MIAYTITGEATMSPWSSHAKVTQDTASAGGVAGAMNVHGGVGSIDDVRQKVVPCTVSRWPEVADPSGGV